MSLLCYSISVFFNSNSCFSEYLGCHIFDIVGIPVQQTLLGTDKFNEKTKIVVACRDFTSPGIVLQDFASLKNQLIDSERNGYGTELSDVLYTCEEQNAVDQVILLERFWDMFIVDALIGNWDRHNGNWGFLYNQINDSMALAPVFDCGSSLYPQADDTIMERVLLKKSEMDYRVYEIPTSAITENDKKIKYFDFISSLKNDGCNRALRRIFPQINMDEIEKMIHNTPFLSDLQKEFQITMLEKRYENIIEFSYRKLVSA